MKVKQRFISVILFFLVLLFFLPYSSLTGKAIPKNDDRYWVISAAERSIYVSRLTGIEKQVLFPNVGEDKNSRIDVINSSYNGKFILCKVVRRGIYSYWLVNLDTNKQEKIIDDLKNIPYNTMISRDGKWVAFQTEAYVAWIYHVPTKELSPFDKNIQDGYVSDIRFSFDSKKALYIKLKIINREEYYTCLCIRDLDKQQDRELTDMFDGSVLSADFYQDNSRILVTRYLQEVGYITLWDYHINTGKFKLIVSYPGEHVSLGYPSRDGKLVAFCSFNPEKPANISFWTYQPGIDPSPIFIKSLPSGLIGLRLSHDAKYIILGTSSSDTYIAQSDGSWSSALSKLVDLPNLQDANFYNHPPFPPEISAEATGNSNRVFWNPSKPGTYDIAGYRVFRSVGSSSDEFVLLSTVQEEPYEYLESAPQSDQVYYYMVRSVDVDQTESIPSNKVMLDRIKPSITIQKPVTGTWFKDASILVEGTAKDAESGLKSVFVHTKQVQINNNGFFSSRIELTEGSNLIQAEAIDNGGNKAVDTVIAHLDTQPPIIDRMDPSIETWTNHSNFTVKCRIADNGSGIHRVLSQQVEKIVDQSSIDFSDQLQLKEGLNKWLVIAEDKVGNRSQQHVNIMLDTIAPVIQVDFPKDNQDLYTLDTYIRGSVMETGSGLHELTLNGVRIEVQKDGTFRHKISVMEGEQILSLHAGDNVGNTASVELKLKGVKKIVVLLTIGQESIEVNGKHSTIDAPPFIHVSSGRTMVPIRFVVEPIGGKIDYDSFTQKITIVRDKDVIILWIGKSTAVVNGKNIPIDQSDSALTPMIQAGRTFLPLRFVSENIGFKVEWDPEKYQVTLTFPAKELVGENS